MDEDKDLDVLRDEFHVWTEGFEDGHINIYVDPFGKPENLPETVMSAFGELKPVLDDSIEGADGSPVYQLLPVSYEGESING